MVYMVAVTCAGVCTYQDEYCYIYIQVNEKSFDLKEGI